MHFNLQYFLYSVDGHLRNRTSVFRFWDNSRHQNSILLNHSFIYSFRTSYTKNCSTYSCTSYCQDNYANRKQQSNLQNRMIDEYSRGRHQKDQHQVNQVHDASTHPHAAAYAEPYATGARLWGSIKITYSNQPGRGGTQPYTNSENRDIM